MAKNEERAQVCADTLCKYLENITQNPDDEVRGNARILILNE